MDDPVQIFSACVEALNRVDRAQLRKLIDPQIVFLPLRAAVSGPFIGYDGMEEFIADNDEMFEMFRAEFDTLEPLPDGRLLAIGRLRLRGTGGEEETTFPTAGIAAFRDGRMLSWHDYGDERKAREAASV